MANFEERIARMEAAGTITPDQAAELRVSTAGASGFESARRRKIPTVWVLVIASVVVVAALVWAAGLDDAPPRVQTVSEMMNDPGEVGAMNKGLSATVSVLVILLPIVLSVLGFVWINNSLVEKEEAVLASWSQVESNYQRRVDLIPNLVETVRSFAAHEKELLTEVTRERSFEDLDRAVEALSRSQQKADELTAEASERLEDEQFMRSVASAQTAVDEHAARIFGLVENYPQLRSSDNFLALQDQLEGTENRVNVARMVFNDSVGDYNSAIRKLPASLVAGLGGFARKAYFQAEDGAESAAEVNLQPAD